MSLSVKRLYTKAPDIIQRPGLLFIGGYSVTHIFQTQYRHPFPAYVPTVWVYGRLRPCCSMVSLNISSDFLSQAVLDSHVQTLSGVFTARFSDSTGDIEINLIFDEKDESRPHLSN